LIIFDTNVTKEVSNKNFLYFPHHHRLVLLHYLAKSTSANSHLFIQML